MYDLPNDLYSKSVILKVLRLLTRLWLGFIHLWEHKFCHNFSNSSRFICIDNDETTEHLLQRCHRFANTRSALLDQMSDIIKNDIKVLPEHRLAGIFLYGDNDCNEIANKLVIEATTAFLKLSKCFHT